MQSRKSSFEVSLMIQQQRLRTHSISIRTSRSILHTANWKEKIWFLDIEKKKGFITLSFVFCFLHMGILCMDILSHFVLESIKTSSYLFTITLLMSHVVSFYWALLGTIYSLHCGLTVLWLLALISALLNFCVFVGRLWFELQVLDFRKEIY